MHDERWGEDEWQPGWAMRWSSTALGLLGLALAALLVAGRLDGAPAARVDAAPAQAASGAASGAPAQAVREFTLTAQEVDWELMPGTVVKAWTFNGTVPGPAIHVTEGDLVRVHLVNNLPVPTTIHWHGVDVPNDMDGVPGMTQDAVQPGDTFTYEFTATNPGTRWYHSHQDPEVQVPLGLFGPLIIDPKTPPAGAVKYDREYTYMLSEWSLALTPDVVEGNASLPLAGPGAPHSKEPDFDLFLMNGHANEDITPITVTQGQHVLVRLINAGSLMHVMHTHGHSFKVVAVDGNFIPPAQQLTKDSVTIGPSERVDIEIYANNPGTWMFHCHIEHHMANGMMTSIQYEGTAAAHTSAAPAPPAPAASTASLSADDPSVQAAGVKISLIDNHYQPPTVTVPAGATVAWINKGANIHTVSSFDGSFDSGSLQPGRAFVYTFTKPGTYQFLCRQHFLSGMSGAVVVQ